MSVYFCGGSCVEDVTSHLMRHLSYHPPNLLMEELTTIQSKIYEIRGQRVMLDFDLAALYQVTTLLSLIHI